MENFRDHYFSDRLPVYAVRLRLSFADVLRSKLLRVLGWTQWGWCDHNLRPAEFESGEHRRQSREHYRVAELLVRSQPVHAAKSRDVRDIRPQFHPRSGNQQYRSCVAERSPV